MRACDVRMWAQRRRVLTMALVYAQAALDDARNRQTQAIAAEDADIITATVRFEERVSVLNISMLLNST